MKPQIPVINDRVTIPREHRLLVHRFAPLLEGRRRWLQNGSFAFEATPRNIQKAREGGFDIIELEGDSPDMYGFVGDRPEFKSPLSDLEHQSQAKLKFEELSTVAYFAEMGTGKTKMAIDKVMKFWCDGKIDVAIVLAKKGVHIQWAEGEVDEDGEQKPSPIEALTQDNISHREWAWKGKAIPDEFLEPFDGITWFCFNFDAIIHKKAKEQLERIIERFSGRAALVGDETHYWKSHVAARTKAAIDVADHCVLRIIMTGTPLAKNLVDEWVPSLRSSTKR